MKKMFYRCTGIVVCVFVLVFISVGHRAFADGGLTKNDIEHITSEIKKMIPVRPEGEFLIKGNIQMKYLKK